MYPSKGRATKSNIPYYENPQRLCAYFVHKVCDILFWDLFLYMSLSYVTLWNPEEQELPLEFGIMLA